MQKQWIWWVLVILWCVLIYNFTASPSYTGGSTQAVIERVAGVSGSAAELINLVVRKATHVTVFGVLAILVFLALSASRFVRSAPVLAWLLATGYGAFDEFHQSLVPGRSASVLDVGFDSIGALAGVILIQMGIKRKNGV